MNFVTIPYQRLEGQEISHVYKLMAYEVIHPSLNLETLSDTIELN